MKEVRQGCSPPLLINFILTCSLMIFLKKKKKKKKGINIESVLPKLSK